LAIALHAAISGLSNVSATRVGEVVTVENTWFGKITPETDAGSTGFTFNVLRAGIGGFLGRTQEGGLSLNSEVQTVEVKADQTAGVMLDKIISGYVVTAETNLLEMTKERWETIVGGAYGDIHTPAAGTSLVGYGTAKVFQSVRQYSGKLVLHPRRLPFADKSEDIRVHKCIPTPSSINFSGTELQVMAVTFEAFQDLSVNDKIDILSYGDHTQDLS
jgi:hypothetical protein